MALCQQTAANRLLPYVSLLDHNTEDTSVTSATCLAHCVIFSGSNNKVQCQLWKQSAVLYHMTQKQVDKSSTTHNLNKAV